MKALAEKIEFVMFLALPILITAITIYSLFK